MTRTLADLDPDEVQPLVVTYSWVERELTDAKVTVQSKIPMSLGELRDLVATVAAAVEMPEGDFIILTDVHTEDGLNVG